MLEVGASAPDFTCKDQNGRPVSLAAFRGVKNVLLVFFPLAFTGICQGELDYVQEHLASFQNDETVTLAISVGPPPTHKVWATSSGFSFPVLSDFWPHGAVASAFGVFNSVAGFANRGTFLVDRAGVIAFADCKEPGEARDESVWTAALESADAASVPKLSPGS
ncbi:peroxiredoxin AhpE [soil metagenome]